MQTGIGNAVVTCKVKLFWHNFSVLFHM